MRKMVLSILTFLFAACGFSQNENTVNAVLGDKSFAETFQQLPDQNTNEVLRIQTHLKYVEELLRSKDVSHLTKQQVANRATALQVLHRYWTTGNFPKNEAYKERRPCFIDREGNICAVGYLIEQTVGRNVAENISRLYQYDYLLDMNEPVIKNWAEEYGFTLEECAMIQPTYGPIPADQTYEVPVKTGYGISSAFATGTNIGVNVVHLTNRSGGKSKFINYLGLVTGTSQVVLGLANIRKDETEYRINGPSKTISYKAQNNLSYINIAAGTTTVLTSAINLLIQNRLKDKRNAFNIYSYPDTDYKLAAGLSFTRSL
ncbi:MAG TPA: hypothetical protein VGB56_08320 [Flavisolibacter sp.]